MKYYYAYIPGESASPVFMDKEDAVDFLIKNAAIEYGSIWAFSEINQTVVQEESFSIWRVDRCNDLVMLFSDQDTAEACYSQLIYFFPEMEDKISIDKWIFFAQEADYLYV